MKSKLLVGLLAFGVAATPALAVELVSNGGFEAGDLTGFSDSSDPELAFASSTAAHTGGFGYLNGNAGQDGVLTQTVATQFGVSYSYSFYLENDGSTPNDVTVKLGNTVLLARTDAAAFGYTSFTGSVVADGNNDVLSFAFRNDNGAFGLDDISLTSSATPPQSAVPEPAIWALLVTGFGLTGLATRRRRELPSVAVQRRLR